MTAADLTDWLETTIDDSFDLGWTSRDAAKLIVSRMQSEGLVIVPAQPASGDVVAWGIYNGPKLGWSIFSIPTVGSDGSQAVPLYAAPSHPAADLVEALVKALRKIENEPRISRHDAAQVLSDVQDIARAALANAQDWSGDDG